MNSKFILTLLTISLFGLSCGESARELSENQYMEPSSMAASDASPARNSIFPDWARNASIYEVNTRNYTPEGTLKAFEEHLPRLKNMGIDIVWLMPVFPISVKKRKGTMGSPYAVADYKAINPDLGTFDDFKSVVEKVHDLGMKIILDWVPNHSGWDNAWISKNPDWYTKDENGNIVDPLNPETGKSEGWTDVADFNYDHPEMRAAMLDALKFWVVEYDVDGFRCDVAYKVPDDFWATTSKTLMDIKPLFLLAESMEASHLNEGYFTANYAWKFKDLVNGIANGENNANDIDSYLAYDRDRFNKGVRIHFTSNHDENTWTGSVLERLGEAHQALAVLAATLDGMPLIYGGQEAPLKDRIEFFEKDTMDWNAYEYEHFYKTLLDLKHQNQALWNGKYGGQAKRIATDNAEAIYAFTREKNGDKVLIILNLSPNTQDLILSDENFTGEYTNVFANSTMSLTEDTEMTLKPWEYLVFSNK